MRVRFRIWIPPIGILIVLITVSLMLAYGIPVTKERLERQTEALTLAQAAATADAITGEKREYWQGLLNLPKSDTSGRAPAEDERLHSDALQRSLDLYATAPGAEIRVVDREGRVVSREGLRLFSPPPETLRSAATGERVFAKTQGLNVAVVPIMYRGRLAGGVVLATREWDSPFYQLFLRSALEAAGLGSVIGAGLMLVLATLLSRRVERLSSEAKAMEHGNLSPRIEPGFGDELGDLAKSLNSMAAKLEKSFSRLEENNETLDTILNNLNEGVLATDLKGNVMFANSAARTMLGMEETKPEVLPDPWEEFDLREAVARCADEQECGEARVRGVNSFLRINLERMPAFDDHRGGVLVVVQDLSEGRRLEEAQQRFLANAAHELRTPLSAITFAAELLMTKGDEDPVARRRFLEHILSRTRKMQRLSESLLKLARVGWDAREPELEPVSLSAVARSVAEGSEPLAESAGLTLVVEGPDAQVTADPALLEEALLILIDNALKHSETGTTVRLRLSEGSVAVEDEGDGIPEEDLPYLFERFYSGEGSSEGFGLGLSICKELVEKMDGEISVCSEKVAGTSVRIELPEAAPHA